MSYLGIDVSAAYSLGLTLRRLATTVEHTQSPVNAAEALAELSTDCMPLLADIEDELRYIAFAIERAATDVGSLVLPPYRWQSRLAMSDATGTSEQGPIRWDAHTLMDWNLVRQDASHNSYKVDGGIEALFFNGVRTFEIDIHVGEPTDFRASIGNIVVDHFDHNGELPGDWHVYHFSGDEKTEYSTLGEGLAALVALPTTDPLTLFLDNKDPFVDGHTAVELDELIVEALGPRVYGPQDLLDRAPGATTLQQAVQIAGWPTVDELSGRIMVVLTDNVSQYPSSLPPSPEHPSPLGQLFVAQKPQFGGGTHNVTHTPEPNVVIYNVDANSISDAEMAAIYATGSLLRTYKNRPCRVPRAGNVFGTPNFRAIDVDGDDDECPDLQPPQDTPVPIVSEQSSPPD